MNRFGLILLISMLTAGVSTPAHADSCDVKAARPTIRVDIVANQPVIDHTRSRNELKRFDIASKSPYGAGANVHVNGLMRGAIALDSNISMAWQRDTRGQSNCFWIQHMQVVMRLDPTIYLAREIPARTCLYNEVLNHEFKHYHVDKALAADYQVILQDELERALQQIGVVGPYSASQRARAQQELARQIEKTVQMVYERLKNDRLARQAAVDTREEYDRVARACPGERGIM